MKKWISAMALAFSAAYSQTIDLSAPGGGALDVRQDPGRRVVVTSDHWRLEFDTSNGGVLDTVAFPRGTGRNLLTRPFATYVDQWSDGNSPLTEFHLLRQGDTARLEFTGALGAAGRVVAPIRFETVWTITPFTVKVDQTLRFDSDIRASSVGIGSMSLRADIDECGWRIGPGDMPENASSTGTSYAKAARAGSVLIQEHHPPLYMVFFKRYVEGLDFNAGVNLDRWESALGRRGGLGRFEARVNADGRSIDVVREPLSVPSPVSIRKGAYTFSYYLGLPRLVEKSPRKYRHVSFGNHPWPSDELIRHWAECGVNLARLHNDYVEDENFWHDGSWPPYDEKGMAELKRVIASCHRYKIDVVPYFSIHEFHPKSKGYASNEQAWKRTTDAAGTVIHNRHAKGEFGAQMCLASGWLGRLKADVERAYRELGFDGIYYDWSANLPCRNTAHRAGWHTGMDGMIDLLAWTRRLVAPRGTLILHISGWLASISFENYGDLIVNMEENSQVSGLPRMEDMALMTVLAEAVPRSPCPSYRKDRPLERNQNNIAQEVVFGLFPWSGQDGPVAEETFKLFRAFKPYRLEDYRLYNAASGAVHTSWPEVYGAVYASANQALVVVSNTGEQPRANIMWTVKPELLGFAPAASVTIKETASGQVKTLPWSALIDGTLQTELPAFGYKVFEVRQGNTAASPK